MSEDSGQSPSYDGNSRVRALRSDLELTRAELGETIAALADKANLKSRAQEYAHDKSERITGTARDLRHRAGERTARLADHRTELAVASVALGAFAAGVLARRRPRSQRPGSAASRRAGRPGE